NFWNRAAGEWFGGKADPLATSFLELLPAEEREKAKHVCADVLATGETHDMEVKYAGPDDREIAMVLILSPAVDAAGRAIGLSASMRDISERKRMSRELANSRRIAALGRMAGGVAHHFNNILGGM